MGYFLFCELPGPQYLENEEAIPLVSHQLIHVNKTI